MTTLDPRALEEAARVRCRQDEELMLLPDWGDLDGDQQDALRGEVSDIITAYLDAARSIVETVEELEGLAVGTIILDRFEDESYTRIVGPRWVSWAEQDGLRHTEVALPARVIWRPHD